MTEEAIERGETLVKSPWSAVMVVTTASTADDEHFPLGEDPSLRRWWGKKAHAPHCRLAAWLLYERSRQEASPWHTYITSLPWNEAESSSVMFWTEEELAMLTNDEIFRRVRDQNQAVESDFVEFQSISTNSNVFPATSLEDWKKAIHLVTSRSFGASFVNGISRRWMWPFLDMANHDFALPCDAGDDESFAGGKSESSLSSQKVDQEGCSMIASRSFAAGDEVCISYGPCPNDACLASFGFVEPNNPYDLLTLDLVLRTLARSMGDPNVPTDLQRMGAQFGDEKGALRNVWSLSREICMQNPDQKVALIRNLGLGDIRCEVGAEGFTEGVSEIVRIACATSPELRRVNPSLFRAPAKDEISATFDAELIAETMAAMDSAENSDLPKGQERTLALLMGICLTCGNQFAAVSAADAPPGASEERLHLAAAYRTGKQTLLRSVLGRLMRAWVAVSHE